MSDERVIDLRSGRGKKNAEAVDSSAVQEAHYRQEERTAALAAFRGPKTTLEFSSEMEFGLWRRGIVAEGQQRLAQTIGMKLQSTTVEEYSKLIVDLGALMGGEEANPIALQNTVRRFLGLPTIATEDGA